MAAPGTIPPLEASAALQRRSPSLLLPEEPSREELAQFWTLSPRDRAEVMRCQGEANQRRFAVQLCTLRTYGRFYLRRLRLLWRSRIISPSNWTSP